MVIRRLVVSSKSQDQVFRVLHKSMTFKAKYYGARSWLLDWSPQLFT